MEPVDTKSSPIQTTPVVTSTDSQVAPQMPTETPTQTLPQTPPQVSQQQTVKPLTENNYDPNKKLKLLGVIILVLAIIVGIVVFLVPMFTKSEPVVYEKPTPPAPIAEIPIATPAAKSKYATDSAILKMKEELNLIQSKINTIDLYEISITPPNIDLDLYIK